MFIFLLVFFLLNQITHTKRSVYLYMVFTYNLFRFSTISDKLCVFYLKVNLWQRKKNWNIFLSQKCVCSVHSPHIQRFRKNKERQKIVHLHINFKCTWIYMVYRRIKGSTTIKLFPFDIASYKNHFHLPPERNAVNNIARIFLDLCSVYVVK